jgi:Conserved hypothetical protein (DUF2461)
MTESSPGFAGFPEAALDFYDDLEIDNTKAFWEAHREVYQTSVKAPMTALVTALEPEFGTAKVFRPFRDVRFAKDKTPYKTHQGAYVGVGPACGWYVEIAAGSGRRSPTSSPATGCRSSWPSSPGPDSRSVATGSRPRRAVTTPTIRASSCCGTAH